MRVTLPKLGEYTREELPAFPRVDLWELQDKLKELGVISQQSTVCAVQPNLDFRPRIPVVNHFRDYE